MANTIFLNGSRMEFFFKFDLPIFLWGLQVDFKVH